MSPLCLEERVQRASGSETHISENLSWSTYAAYLLQRRQGSDNFPAEKHLNPECGSRRVVGRVICCKEGGVKKTTRLPPAFPGGQLQLLPLQSHHPSTTCLRYCPLRSTKNNYPAIRLKKTKLFLPMGHLNCI